MNRNNKLLFVTTIGTKGSGLFSRPYLMAKQLKALEINFAAVTFGFDVSELGMETYDIPLGHPLRLSRFLEISHVSRILSKITRVAKPDVIYVHQPANILAVALNRFGPGIPVVGDFHSLYSSELSAWGKHAKALFSRLIERICVKSTVRLTVASREIKDTLVQRRVDPTKIMVVPNSIDTDQYNPIKEKSLLRSELGLPGNLDIVAFTAPRAFFSNVLAISHLYRVARILETRRPKLLFVILGSGHPIAPVPANVHYTGFVENLNMWLNACDIAVAPYPRAAVCGGARNKILEYWSCGLPIVTTKEGLRGLGALSKLPALVSPDDPQGIAEAISSLLSDGALRKRLSLTGREFVVDHYDWRAMTETVGHALSDYLHMP